MVAFFFVFGRSVNLRPHFRRMVKTKGRIMKWLTIEYIKKHSRIDYDCEDDLLELYGNAAEDMVMNTIRRDYDEIVEKFGTDDAPVPAALIQASLILVDTSYMQRTAVSPAQLYTVPYTFDFLVKPYMKLAGNDESENV